MLDRLIRVLRAIVLGRKLTRAKARNQEAATRLDAAVREVLRK